MVLRRKTLKRIESINALIAQYGQMTLRQIYYQLAPMGINYRNTMYACKVGRLQGLIPWKGIVDRVRPTYSLGKTFPDIRAFLDDIKDYFHLDYWQYSDNHVEIWTEKDTLSQIFKEIANPLQVDVRVTRGFLSLSNKVRWGEENLTILYFGDFDPSGLFIDEDLQWSQVGYKNFNRIALKREHIDTYDLPSIKVNRRDPRAPGYLREYGEKGWEIDALPPDVLTKMVRDAIMEYVDFGLEKMRESEEMYRQALELMIEEKRDD